MRKLVFALLASIVALFAQPTPVSAVSQTVTLHPTADTQVHQGNASTNYGGYTLMQTGIVSSSHRALGAYIKFSLSSIPVGSTINSAKLRLYMEVSSGSLLSVSYGLWRPLSNWSENSLTWSNQPSQSTRLHVITIGRENQYYEWDVKETVKKWLDSTYPNYGVYVSGTVADTEYTRSFRSREAATNKPELVINYSAPTPTIPQIILNPTIMAGIMDALNDNQQAGPTATPTPQPTSTPSPEPTSPPVGGQADQPAPTTSPVYIVMQNEQPPISQTASQPTASPPQTTTSPTEVAQETVTQTTTVADLTPQRSKKKSQELFAGMSAPVLGSAFIGLIIIAIIAVMIIRKKLFKGTLPPPAAGMNQGSEQTKIIIMLLTILVITIVLILGLIFGYILSQTGKGEQVLSSHVTESGQDAPPGFTYSTVEVYSVFSPQ